MSERLSPRPCPLCGGVVRITKGVVWCDTKECGICVYPGFNAEQKWAKRSTDPLLRECLDELIDYRNLLKGMGACSESVDGPITKLKQELGE